MNSLLTSHQCCFVTYADADINIAQPLFEKLAGRPPNAAGAVGFGGGPSLQVSWDFVDCGELINGTIKMLVKPGGSAYFQSLNFANSREMITAVQVNGELLRHSTSNYWDWSPARGPIAPRAGFNIALLGANREILRARIPQLRSQDIGVQFSLPANATAPAAEATPTVVEEPPVEAAPGPAPPAPQPKVGQAGKRRM